MKTTHLVLVLAGLAMALYLTTWTPVVTWAHFGEDGAELETAGRTLGIPHPTGYPLFTALVRVVSLVVPVPVSAVNVLNLLAAAAAVVAVGLAGRALADKVTVFPSSWFPSLVGLLSGAFFAASLTWWKQASIGEVYTLHVAILSSVLALVFAGGPRNGLLAAYLLGLGLTHHLQTLPFLVLIVAYLLLYRKHRLRPPHLLAFLAPLTLWVALVVRSRVEPPLDWGNPETLRNLWWALSGAPFRSNLLADGAPAMLGRWQHALVHLPAVQLGWGGALLAVVGVIVAARQTPREAVTLGALFVGTTLLAASYVIPDPAAYYLPAVVAVSLFCGLGAAWIFTRAATSPRIGFVGVAAVAGIIGGSLFAEAVGARAEAAVAREDWSAFGYAAGGVAALEDNALVIANGDGRAFSLWYATQVLTPRRDVAVVYETLLDWPWYRDQVKRNHPWVKIPAQGITRSSRRALLIGWHLDDRPVYVTELDDKLYDRFDTEPAGPLLRVRRPDRIAATVH